MEQQLDGTMHEKPFLIMLLSAKQETSQLLGESAGAADDHAAKEYGAT